MTDPKEAAPKWAEAVVEAFRPPLVWDECQEAFVPGNIHDDPPPHLITPYQRWLRDKEEWEE